MAQTYGNCGTGYVYGDARPDLPRRVQERPPVVDREPKRYGFDWPGIGAPPRRRDQLAWSERRARRSWDEN